MGVDTALTGVPQFDKLEIVKSGVFTLNKPSGSSYAFDGINHGLGYTPIALVYANPDIPLSAGLITDATSFSFNVPFTLYSGGIALDDVKPYVSTYTSSTNEVLIFNIYTPNITNGSYYNEDFDTVFRYYLLKDRAQLNVNT